MPPADEWVTLTTRSSMWSSIREINALRLWLETNGIMVFLPDEFTTTMDWFWLIALGGIRLQVPKSQLAEAQSLMREWEASRKLTSANSKDAITEDAIEWQKPLSVASNTCPSCHSQNTRDVPNQGLLVLFALFIFTLLLLFLGSLLLMIFWAPFIVAAFFVFWHHAGWKYFECCHCKHTWKEREEPPHEPAE